MNIEQKRLEIWKGCIEHHWNNLGLNCLYCAVPVDDDTFQRLRLNFRDDKILKLEACRLTTDEEKQETGRSSVWVVLQEADYLKVTMDENGGVDFGGSKEILKSKPSKKKAVKKTKEPKQSKKKERSS